MKIYSKTYWTKLIAGFIAGGALLAGVFFSLMPATSCANEGSKTESARTPKPRAYKCKDKDVLVDFNYANVVDPEIFTICQGSSANGKHWLTWKKGPNAHFESFTADFGNDTPFEDKDGKPVSQFVIAPGNPGPDKGLARDLNIPQGLPRYYKYKVTICPDSNPANCEEQDPGGVIMP